ncbi:MAG: UvrD-helicase domain-containing protein [Candidatus Buchananbacteria bacterium]|nr:UvrD-helicase domain-containing protein [Candidatus Buchananbacteria bacterium]
MPNLLENLNSQQKEAVTHDRGPLLIVAGAGTGKTTVITSRIAYLIEQERCLPEEILALTFTDRAAGEMEERVDKLLPYGYVDLWISTFHSFAERILKENGLEIGLPTDFKLLSETGQWMLVRNNLDKFEIDYYKPLGNPTKYIHTLIKHFSRAKDENITPVDYQKYVDSVLTIKDQAQLAAELLEPKEMEELTAEELNQAVAQELKKLEETAKAYQTYQKLLLDNNCLDFGDLISYLLKLFLERKSILAHYRSKFKYILVDEFQDTNFAQYQLVKLLASPKNNITVVGDDDQAIYKFRGASISNILQFKDDYKEAKEIFLNTNYRSAQNILDLSYKFIQLNNPYRLEVKLANGKEAKDGLSKKLAAHNPQNGEIGHLHGQSLADEVKLVVDKIIDIYNKNEKLKWSDFAVLVRANSSANEFIYALEQAKVPYNFLASKGLYAKKIILDILAFLKLLDNYHESIAMYRFIAMPLWDIPHGDIVNFNYWAGRKGWSLYETCHRADELPNINSASKKRVSEALQFLTDFSKSANSGQRTTEIIQGFMDQSGYLKYLTGKDCDKNHEELAYLNQFFKKVQEFEKENNDKSVKSFLALIELELESGEEGSLQNTTDQDDPDTVKIMTVHASKGLEFEYVFLPNMVDKRFPTTAKGEAIKLPDKLIKEIVPEGDMHLQEERRLFYVAMTRSKNGLYFSSAENYGGARAKKISRFLEELKEIGLTLSSSAKTTAKPEDIKEKEADKSIKPKLPAKFSFTRLKAFETCPYQYRFAFVLKVPTPGKPQFSFGRSMHNSLQKLLELANKRINFKQPELLPSSDKQSIDWADVLAIYQESFIDDWYPNQKVKEQYWNKGEKSLKDFYEKNKDHWPKTMYLEYPFNLHLKNGEENFTLYGVIDRIDQVEGGVRIVDYKTGTAKEKLTLEDKEQLLIYQMAVEEVLKEPVKELVFHYLDDNKEMSFLGKPAELEKIKDKILNNINGIKLADFPPKPGLMCKYCYFNSICEFKAG